MISPLSDQQFARHVSALLINNTEFVHKFREILNPRFFADSPELAWICKTSIDFYDAHGSAPTVEVIDMLSRDKLPNQVRAPLIDKVLDSIEAAGTPVGSVYDFICDHLQQFCQKQHIILAAKDWGPKLDTDPQGFIDAVAAAARIKIESESFITIPDDIEDLFAYFNPDHLAAVSIPTSLQILDNYLGGGLRPGELGIVLAPTGRGKSQWLNFVGAAALRFGENVAHFSLENSKEEVMSRYYSNLLRKPIEKIIGEGSVDEMEAAYRKVTALLDRLDSNAKIFAKYYSPGVTSVDALDRDMERLEEAGKKTGLIIADYGDLMTARSSRKGISEYEEQGNVFSELRDLGMRHGCPIWTATQANRSALSSKHVKLNQIAESVAKAMKADVIIAMSQTEKEAKMVPSRMRLQLVKMRRARTWGKVIVDADLETATFEEAASQFEDEDFDDED